MFLFKLFFRNSNAAVVIAAGLLAGCTTTQPVQDCSPKEITRLSAGIAPTQNQLDRHKRKLSHTRGQISKERCNGSLFSPAIESARCDRLKATTNRLENEINKLEGRLSELNAVVAGRPSSSQHVKACSASWMPKGQIQKAVRKKLAPAKKTAVKATKKVEHIKRVSRTYNAPVNRSPDIIKADPMTGLPTVISDVEMPSVKTDNVAPASISAAPAASATTAIPPIERAYTDNPNVRVVGSSFFPDQSVQEGQPAPARVPAQ